MARFAALAYGAICYLIFFASFLYLAGFLIGLGVPKDIDDGLEGPIAQAFVVDLGLLLLFALQHSIMARPRFKNWWVRIVPRPIERSTYVLLTSLILLGLFVYWQPIPVTIWEFHGAIGWGFVGLFAVGVMLVLYSTFLIDHFDLFGLRQVFLYMQGEDYAHKRFMIPSLYHYVRHPLYIGWIITFWATPWMTVGHLLFATVWTTYIFVAIPLEEEDLGRVLGDDYLRYRAATPMMIPGLRGRTGSTSAPTATS